jgi:hypothetical protein
MGAPSFLNLTWVALQLAHGLEAGGITAEREHLADALPELVPYFLSLGSLQLARSFLSHLYYVAYNFLAKMKPYKI